MWNSFDGGELWSSCDRFGIIPCPNGWWCRDQKTNDASPVFASPDAAIAWAEDRFADPPFDGATPLQSTTAGYKEPPPPGLNN